jgi:sarcosine oxidase, subunit gamma
MPSGSAVRGNDSVAPWARPTVLVEQCEPRAKLLFIGEEVALNEALATSIEIPAHPNTVVHTALGVCLWLRPDQRLLVLSAKGAITKTAQRLRALDTQRAWTLDTGARYVEFRVSGRGAAAVLNAGCSLDLRDRAFPMDACAQTRFVQIPLILFRSAPECFELLVERPLAHHLWRWLCRAADDL